MYCKKCGKELKATDRFCSGCGARIDVNDSFATMAAGIDEKPEPRKKESRKFHLDGLNWDLAGYPTEESASTTASTKFNWSSVVDERDREIAGYRLPTEPVRRPIEPEPVKPKAPEPVKYGPEHTDLDWNTGSTMRVEKKGTDKFDDFLFDLDEENRDGSLFKPEFMTGSENYREPEEEPVKEWGSSLKEAISAAAITGVTPEEIPVTPDDSFRAETIVATRSRQPSEDAVESSRRKIDKFYTFNKKNEEFQALLDQEYERLRERIREETKAEEELAAKQAKLEAMKAAEELEKQAAAEAEKLAAFEAEKAALEAERAAFEAEKAALEAEKIAAAAAAAAVIEPVVEPIIEPVVEKEAEPEEEPVPETAEEHVFEPAPEPELVFEPAEPEAEEPAPEETVEPETVFEAEPEAPAEPEQFIEVEPEAEPVTFVEHEEVTEAEPEIPAEPEQFIEPEKFAEAEPEDEPEVPAEPEQFIAQETPAAEVEIEEPKTEEAQIEFADDDIIFFEDEGDALIPETPAVRTEAPETVTEAPETVEEAVEELPEAAPAEVEIVPGVIIEEPVREEPVREEPVREEPVKSEPAASAVIETPEPAAEPVAEPKPVRAAAPVIEPEYDDDDDDEDEDEEPRRKRRSRRDKKAEREAARNNTFGDIFDEEEEDDDVDYDTGRRKGRAKLIFLDILIVILALCVVCAAILVFAEGSPLAKKLQGGIDKIVSLITGEEAGGDEQPGDTVSYTTAAIENQISRNSNIDEIAEDTALNFSADHDYGVPDVLNYNVFEDSVFYEDGSGKQVNYSDEVIGTIIEYYSKLVDRMNTNDQGVLDLIVPGSQLYGGVSAITADPAVQHDITKLQIGEVRENDRNFYVLVRATQTATGVTDPTISTQVLHLTVDGNKVFINDIVDAK